MNIKEFHLKNGERIIAKHQDRDNVINLIDPLAVSESYDPKTGLATYYFVDYIPLAGMNRDGVKAFPIEKLEILSAVPLDSKYVDNYVQTVDRIKNPIQPEPKEAVLTEVLQFPTKDK